MYLVNPADAILGPKASELAGVASVHRAQRNAAVVTAVHVARDLYIEQLGDRVSTPRQVERYIHTWLVRNGADQYVSGHRKAIEDLVEAVWALAELPEADPMMLVDDEDWRGTPDEARDHLRSQYERDLQFSLNRITWKDR